MHAGESAMTAIDRAHLAAQTGGDEALAAEILGLFAAQCRRLLPGIADRSLAFPDRADLAHTLKGSAAGIGAGRVQDLAGRVEAALRDAAEPGAEIAALEEQAAAALAEIADAA